MSEAKKELEEAMANYKRQAAIAKEAGRKLKENHPSLHNFERLCELEVDYASLLDRHNELKEATRGLRDGLRLIHSGDHEDGAHSVAGYTLNLWRKELDALVGEE